MQRITGIVRDHPWVVATLIVVVLTLGLHLPGAEGSARGIASAYALVAFLGGMSRAATSGAIVKSGGTIEALGAVRTVAFDKTGTLTAGRPELVGVRPAAGMTEDEVLRLAASAEQYSLHVVAEATGRHIAGEAGIDEVHADLLPADKVRLLSARPVMMVGDGVNDVPVLAATASAPAPRQAPRPGSRPRADRGSATEGAWPSSCSGAERRAQRPWDWKRTKARSSSSSTSRDSRKPWAS